MKEFLLAVILYVIPALGAETLILNGMVESNSQTKVTVDASGEKLKVLNQNNFNGSTEVSVVTVASRGPASETPKLVPVLRGQELVRLQDLKGPRWLMVTVTAP